MAGYLVEDTRKVTTHRLIEMKQQGKKIAMLTSYDYTMARIVDGAGVDVILIGDSASNVMAGNTTTLPITLNQMIYHATSVMHGVERALVVCDMPFGSYQISREEALRNACRMMKETGVDALKLEGGVEMIDTIKALIDAGIPVHGHLGLTPQSVNKFGGYGIRAKEEAEAKAKAEAEELVKGGEVKVENKETLKVKHEGGVVIEGASGLLVRIAKCCNPVPGDDIVGYITKGRGVAIHRVDCMNLRAQENYEQRLLDVEWEDQFSSKEYTAHIDIYGLNRTGLLNDVLQVLSNTTKNISTVNAQPTKDMKFANIHVCR